MNDPNTPDTSNSETGSDPDSSSRIGTDGERFQEGWLDRLKTAIGLKTGTSIREELAEALASGQDIDGGFTPEERAMLSNILRLREVRVDDVMVPRADIDAVDVEMSVGELLLRFRETGHSRMPVYRETLDDPIGFVHIKDLMAHLTEAAVRTPPSSPNGGGNGNGNGKRQPQLELDLATLDLGRTLEEAALVRNILFVPPSMPVPALLASMQASRMQMALVIDEYGGTDGVVSLEDVVEMVVGDIEDEYDEDTSDMIVSDGEGVFVADARADLDEVAAAIGTDFAGGDESEDIDTVGGLVYSLIGRIPVRGELVSVPGGFEFEILDADPRRIKRLRIYRREAGAPRPELRRRQRVTESATGA